MIFAFGPQTSLSKKTRWKAKRKPEDDPQVELDVLEIQRSQEPSVDDDSEGRKSDDGDQEDIYTERVGEEAPTDLMRKAVSSAFRRQRMEMR